MNEVGELAFRCFGCYFRLANRFFFVEGEAVFFLGRTLGCRPPLHVDRIISIEIFD